MASSREDRARPGAMLRTLWARCHGGGKCIRDLAFVISSLTIMLSFKTDMVFGEEDVNGNSSLKIRNNLKTEDAAR